MASDELKRHLDKTFYYLNELYAQAVNRRNSAIEVAERLQSIKAATQMNDPIMEIQKMHRQALAKMRSAGAEAEAMLEGDDKSELDENIALWQKACDKIKIEFESLTEISEEIAAGRLEPAALQEAYERYFGAESAESDEAGGSEELPPIPPAI